MADSIKYINKFNWFTVALGLIARRVFRYEKIRSSTGKRVHKDRPNFLNKGKKNNVKNKKTNSKINQKIIMIYLRCPQKIIFPLYRPIRNKIIVIKTAKHERLLFHVLQ